MRLTPLDLRRARFSSAVRGFNREEVSGFLDEAATDFERTVRHADQARQEADALQAQLEEHESREATRRETLITAQRVSCEVRETAKREAELIVAEARQHANNLVREARHAGQQAERELDELQHRRHDAEQSVEDAIATLRTALDLIRRQDLVTASGHRHKQPIPAGPGEKVSDPGRQAAQGGPHPNVSIERTL